jgi:hypothetical protein
MLSKAAVFAPWLMLAVAALASRVGSSSRGPVSVPFGGPGTINAGATRYMRAWGTGTNANEGRTSFFCLGDGILRNLYLRTTGIAQPATGSLTVTVRKNLADTALLIVIPPGGVIGVYNSGALAAACTTGDRISLQLVNAAASVATNIEFIGFRMDRP